MQQLHDLIHKVVGIRLVVHGIGNGLVEHLGRDRRIKSQSSGRSRAGKPKEAERRTRCAGRTLTTLVPSEADTK